MTIYALQSTEASKRDALDGATRVPDELSEYLRLIAESTSDAFADLGRSAAGVAADPSSVLRALLRPTFNYQSMGRIAHLVADAAARLSVSLDRTGGARFYLLLHGGYRVDPFGERHGLVFAPDLTELMLVYQIARLRSALLAVGVEDFQFTIVINNGVAAVTNDIAYAATEAYCRRLRRLIARLGAAACVRVLVQSELDRGDFETTVRAAPARVPTALSPVEHGIVERFLGRECSIREAAHRSALYGAAEAAWGGIIRAIADADTAIILRQVASPDCLSFRPFPGGAIRIQNGTIGFRVDDRKVVPILVSPVTARERSVERTRFDPADPAAEVITALFKEREREREREPALA